MKGVHQTAHAPPDGNCFEACLATVLGIELEDVPHFGSDGDWWERVRDLLASWGLGVFEFDCERWGDWRPTGYWIGTIDVGTHHHSLVYRDEELVWQPDHRWSIEDTLAGGFKLIAGAIIVITDIEKMRESPVGRERALA